METIDRFEIINQLPQTGFASVYRVIDPYRDQVTVLKVLPPMASAGFDWYQRYLDRLAAINHPIIVPIYQAYRYQDQFLILMQEMTGGSLYQRFASGPVPTSEATRTVAGLAQGLDGLHRQGIYHHNITPHNILFNQAGQAFLSDFGLTHLLVGNPQASRHWILGNPAYMSPEFLMGRPGLAAAPDIYALAAVYYHALTGSPPYQAQAPAQAAVDHLHKPLHRLSKRNRQLPKSARQVIAAATAPRPGARYPSASEFAKVLRKQVAATARPAIPRKVLLPISLLVLLIAGLVGLFIQRLGGPSPAQLAASRTALALVASQTYTQPLPTPSITPVPPSPTSTSPGRTPDAVLQLLNTPTISPTPTLALPSLGGADKIAFLYRNDIWQMNIDGTQEDRLTFDEEPKSDLFWSQDGNAVIFRSKDNLYQVNIHSKIVSRATELDPYPQKYCKLFLEEGYRDTQYSRDGLKAAAIVNTIDAQGQFAEDVKVYNIKETCTNPPRIDQFPAQRFAMAGYKGTLSEFAWNGSDLFILNIDRIHEMGEMVIYNMDEKKSEVYEPVQGECCYRDFAWSPDGLYLMFVYQNIATAQTNELYYVPYGTLGSNQVYTSIPLPDYLDFDPAQRLYPALRPVIQPKALATPQPLVLHSDEPVVIAGVDKIAFIRNQDIWMVNPDGSNLERITSDGNEKTNLQWTPDGEALVYKTASCHYMVDIETQTIVKIGCFNALQFSTSGTEVLVSDFVDLGDKLPRLRARRLPFAWDAFQRLTSLDLLDTLGACAFPLEGDLYRWSSDTHMVAMVSEASIAGRSVDNIGLYRFGDYDDPTPRISSFPDTHFTLRGYSEATSQPLIPDFAWDGGSLFALTGNVKDNFGDLVIFDVNSGVARQYDPLKKSCCYRDFRWSPDNAYFFFTTPNIDQLELYFIPYEDMVSGVRHEPLPLPSDFFDAREMDQLLYPALRPADRPQLTHNQQVEREISPDTLHLSTLESIRTEDKDIFSLAFSPDDTRLATGTELTVRVWQVGSQQDPVTFEVGSERHTAPVTAVDFFQDQAAGETWLASASADHTFRIWRTSTTSPFQPYDNGLPVLDLEFHPLRPEVAMASSGNRLEIRKISNAGLVQSFEGHTAPVLRVDFSSDGKLLASGSADHTARVWDVDTGKLVQEFPVNRADGHLSGVSDVAITPDGQVLATGSWDGLVKLWRISTGELIANLVGHRNAITSLAISPDGRYLFSASEDHTITAWRLEDQALVWRSNDLNTSILDIAISHQGDVLAAGTANGALFLWNLSESNP